MARAMLDEVGAPHRPRGYPLHGRPAVGHRLDDPEVVEIPHLVVVLRVGDGGAQHLLDQAAGRLRGVLQRGQRLPHRLAPDVIQDEAGLGGGHPDVARGRLGAHAQDFPVGEAAAFSAWPCALKVRVSANSPSRWPTMFSVTYTGMNFLPLCTASVWPTNSGAIVDRRDHVLRTFFWRERLSSSIRPYSFSSMKGPFLVERPMPRSYFFRRVTIMESDGRAPRRVL